MGLMQYMDMETLHNEIAMDNTKRTVNLIVEGATDATLFEGFVDEEKCNIYYVREKANVVNLMTALEAENKNAVTVAIVDDDYDELFGIQRPANTFRTDTNDIETMIFFSDAFYTIARQLLPISKVSNKAAIDSIRLEIIDWVLPIGRARILSKRNTWQLCFKENANGKPLEFKKLYNRNDMAFKGDENLITVLRNHKGIHQPDNNTYKDNLAVLIKENITCDKVIVGHDVSRAIEYAIIQYWHKKENAGMTRESIEIVFRTAYTKDLFHGTQLYTDLSNAIPGIDYLQ